MDSGETIVAKIDHSWKAYTASVAKWNLPDGNDSAWPAAEEIAKVGDQPWGTPTTEGNEPLACPHFRKDFRILKPVRRATVYASALGLYRLHINGEPVTDDCLNPGWTDYHRRVYYNTYDVTGLVRGGGTNAIGATLAAGWYSGAIGWMGERFHYGRLPAGVGATGDRSHRRQHPNHRQRRLLEGGLWAVRRERVSGRRNLRCAAGVVGLVESRLQRFAVVAGGR